MAFGEALQEAFAQAWPPFALVAGLLAIGAAADSEGLFARAASLIRGRTEAPVAALAGLLILEAAVTAILNLDTAAAFMTPLMLYAARELGADEAPFLYGSVFMANASSLFLPGSNLTNLLVLNGKDSSGTSFFVDMLAPALIAAGVTGAGLLVWAALRSRHDASSARDESHQAPAWRPGLGVFAVAVSGVLVVSLHDPALPVLAIGLIVGGATLSRRALTEAIGPVVLVALLAVAVLLGTLARQWTGLETGLTSLTRWETTAVAAVASVLANNLPAAALLSAHPPADAGALLIGLNLGPNLAVTGSLSALIWWRAARRLDAHPSILRYSLAGAPLAVIAISLSTLGP